MNTQVRKLGTLLRASSFRQWSIVLGHFVCSRYSLDTNIIRGFVKFYHSHQSQPYFYSFDFVKFVLTLTTHFPPMGSVSGILPVSETNCERVQEDGVRQESSCSYIHTYETMNVKNQDEVIVTSTALEADRLVNINQSQNNNGQGSECASSSHQDIESVVEEDISLKRPPASTSSSSAEKRVRKKKKKWISTAQDNEVLESTSVSCGSENIQASSDSDTEVKNRKKLRDLLTSVTKWRWNTRSVTSLLSVPCARYNAFRSWVNSTNLTPDERLVLTVLGAGIAVSYDGVFSWKYVLEDSFLSFIITNITNIEDENLLPPKYTEMVMHQIKATCNKRHSFTGCSCDSSYVDRW